MKSKKTAQKIKMELKGQDRMMSALKDIMKKYAKQTETFIQKEDSDTVEHLLQEFPNTENDVSL